MGTYPNAAPQVSLTNPEGLDACQLVEVKDNTVNAPERCWAQRWPVRLRRTCPKCWRTTTRRSGHHTAEPRRTMRLSPRRGKLASPKKERDCDRKRPEAMARRTCLPTPSSKNW